MTSAESAPLLLDTHYWVWLQFGTSEPMPSAIRTAIDRAASAGLLFLSVMSVWEVGMLESKGRIQLHLPVEEWVKQALASPGLMVAPLTPEIALDSSRLPGSFHGDATDRIIVATARRMGARLATRDDKIREYGRKRHVLIL